MYILTSCVLCRSRRFWPGNRAAAPLEYPVDGLRHEYLAGANGVKCVSHICLLLVLFCSRPRHVSLLMTCRIHTVTTGTSAKPLMLLLHGFPELWTMWKHQMSEFSDKYNVAAIDMRGYGRSDRPMVRSRAASYRRMHHQLASLCGDAIKEELTAKEE